MTVQDLLDRIRSGATLVYNMRSFQPQLWPLGSHQAAKSVPFEVFQEAVLRDLVRFKERGITVDFFELTQKENDVVSIH